MNKFEPGDRVRIIALRRSAEPNLLGKVGYVVEEDGVKAPEYAVRILGGYHDGLIYLFDDNEITADDERVNV